MPSIERPRQPFDMALVLWDDATELDAGWTDEIEEVEPHIAMSVGFIIKSTRSHIVLAMDIDKDGLHNGRAQIPRGMVKDIKILRKADR